MNLECLKSNRVRSYILDLGAQVSFFHEGYPALESNILRDPSPDKLDQTVVMVRIKYRYLLVHILYPDPADLKAKTPSKVPKQAVPDLVQFHRPSPNDLTPQLLWRTIQDQVLMLYGDYGLGLVSRSLFGKTHTSLDSKTLPIDADSVKYFSPATSTAIVRCSRAHYRLVWAALSFMTQLPKTSSQGQPTACAIQVVRVSGTIKKAEEEAIRRARAAILRAKRESGEGSTDGLLGILGKEDDGALQGGENMMAGSDVSEENDEMGGAGLDSDENG